MIDLKRLFRQLDTLMQQENNLRFNSGATPLKEASILVMGQMCLLADEKAADNLHLTETVDMDAESALVSRAIKEKNKFLIIEALASEEFPRLAERIESSDGDLNYFLGEDIDE